jgi:hypothetical protein
MDFEGKRHHHTHTLGTCKLLSVDTDNTSRNPSKIPRKNSNSCKLPEFCRLSIAPRRKRAPQQKGSVVAKKKRPRVAGGVLTIESMAAWPSSELLLGRLRCWRRSGWFRCSGLGSRRSRAGLNGVLLVIQADDVLRNIDLI